jgi:hypothetical protein
MPPHHILATAVWQSTPLRVGRGRKSYVQRAFCWGEVDRDNLGYTFKNRLKSVAPNRGRAKQTLRNGTTKKQMIMNNNAVNVG